MGILILLIQMIFHISTAIFVLGFTFILFSLYESFTFKRIIEHREEQEKISQILTQFKWFNFVAIIPILFSMLKFVADSIAYRSISEFINEDPILFINLLIIGGIFLHISIRYTIKEIEKEILGA